MDECALRDTSTLFDESRRRLVVDGSNVKNLIRSDTRLVRALASVAMIAGVVAVPTLAEVTSVNAVSTTLVISEFRLRGPSGANDEFIEIQNISASAVVVADSGAGTGFAIVASDGTARCIIPNSTVIPPYAHYLCTNSVAYSLGSYAAGAGTTATGDATYTVDIPDNAGIALFNTSIAANFDLARQIDAVGSNSEANALYREGAGYPALTPFSIDYSFTRNISTENIQNIALTTSTPGISEDTDTNATDFVFVDTNGTSAGAGQRLGAPGPENLSSAVPNGSLVVSLLDPCVGAGVAPNAIRDLTSVPAENSTFGTITFRRTITNNTGSPVTKLRLRIADQRTFPAPSGTADMRSITAPSVAETVDLAPCGAGTSSITVRGTTLEQPPSSPNGTAFNGSVNVDFVSLATPLAAGASVDVALRFGLQQTGGDAVRIIAEAVTAGTVTAPVLSCLGMTNAADVTNLCNTAPVAVDDNFAATEDVALVVPANGVLANDTDVDLDTLTAVPGSVVGPTNGVVVLAADGSFTYTPTANYNGPDSFTYTTTDGTATSSAATVTLTVAAANDAPVAVPNVGGAVEGTQLSVPAPGPLADDTDIDGDALTAVLVTAPLHAASFSLAADGSYQYRPAAGFVGVDSFSYAASDGIAQSNVVTVTITVVRGVGTLPTTGSSTIKMVQLSMLLVFGGGLLLGGVLLVGRRRIHDLNERT